MQLVSQFRTDKRGSVAVAFAITSIPVLMATGAAIDYSRATRERSAMQQALDQALLSAALVKPAERETTAVNTYRASTRQTARTDDTLSFRTDEAARVLHGTATAKVPMFLTKLGGFKSLEVGVTGAVSLSKNPVCMLLTAPDGVALKMGSSSLIKMPGCEIDVRSVAASASTSAADLNSSAVVDAQELCVAGQIKSSLSRSYYKSACKPIEDKWAAKMPKMMPDSSCLYNGKTYKNQNNLPAFSPGTICNGMTFSTSATVTFLPGVYRVRNGAIAFNAASRLIAEGVTFYFEDAKSYFSMNANAQMTITPPSTGATAGIAMFEAPGLSPSNMDFVSASNTTTDGLFYLPSRNLNLNSSTGFSARKMNVVAYTATFASSSTWVVDPVPQDQLRVYDGVIALVN